MIALCVHGGAGDRQRSPDDEHLLRALREALDAGWAVLETGGSALDAVQVAIGTLEDEPLFNAGRGASLALDGAVELDAALMEGATERAGAVIGVQRVRNPIAAARAVLEHCPHVIMAGAGAERFAQEHGCDMVEPEFFITERARRALAHALERRQQQYGTVGAVALDMRGVLAAGNSTGGTSGKLSGRVGDTPIIGAGTYANQTVAVACTGEGEYFIRVGAALRLAMLVECASYALEHAATEVLQRVAQLGGRGGLIAIDRNGAIAMPFNTTSMARAWRTSQGDYGCALW
ncbi:MAG: isoaspartyl peptidase/L-asparaginase [Bacteroidota bacterium]|nr:isoaspartyl peptidase/L-asparaginase [Candidatus Kapabacteria bacterium]MCS7302913.1 isoaspartyl peptidase/L-asparaginase [Candidatus Kapabacteria bacterium]MCX7937461.1 isoaspartyl peptidase/L-asparaginase [Chlorobiota bacterium]MDW8075093.1 isoaspartyl peptidase/L-asparaginase [Bacteroidota bacterium]MDW8272018.1 isoaspartyl peptidase/L-asparaginase [Bacteroidota bacterium]